MKCIICGRDNLTGKELGVHTRFFHKGIANQAYQQPQNIASGVCIDCGATLVFQEGCVQCHYCGFSKCG
jgi:hypothetical protein